MSKKETTEVSEANIAKTIKEMKLGVLYPMYLKHAGRIYKKLCSLHKGPYHYTLQVFKEDGKPEYDYWGKRYINFDMKEWGDKTHVGHYYLSKQEPYLMIMNRYKYEKRELNRKIILAEKNFLSL